MDPTTSTSSLRYSNAPSRISGHKAFLWIISSLIVLAWLVLWLWGRSPYSRYLSHEQLGEVGLSGGDSLVLTILLYVVGWMLMTVAMMLPTTLPLLEIFRRLTARRSDRTALLMLAISGYLAVWMGFGFAAHAADWVVHESVESVPWLEANSWLIGAATLLIAGGFQFSKLKYRCLDKCRVPLSFVMERWRGRHDRRNAFLLGVTHGLFCVGCCWALMLLMFGIGVGNIGWMLGLGALMSIEKNFPWGKKLSAPVGVALLVSGALIFFRA